MSFRRFFNRFSSTGSRRSPDEQEQRYDDVQIVSAVNGTVIKGHEAVKAYFEHERELHEVHGASIAFQVFRINLQADTIQALSGERLAEVRVDGSFVSGTDTVAAVKDKVRALLVERARLAREAGAQAEVSIDETDHFTFVFGGRPMRDDSLFYADNFVMLPAWVQVYVHGCTFEEVARRAAELRPARGHTPDQQPA